jgi:hypothetical protein
MLAHLGELKASTSLATNDAPSSGPICKLAGAIVLSANRQSNMPTDFVKKWTGDGCTSLQSIGIADIFASNILHRMVTIREGGVGRRVTADALVAAPNH